MNKFFYFFKKNILWIIFVLCLVISAFFVVDIFNNELIGCDLWAYNYFVNTLRNVFLTTIMKGITFFGSAVFLIAITLSFVFVKNKKIGICVAANLFFITVLNQLLKFIVQRPRPSGYNLIKESGYSFPSGHSMVSVAFYGFLIFLIIKYIKNKPLKYFLSSLLIIVVILIGISRIYLGVHYATDVLVGAVLSIAYLIVFIKSVSLFVFNEVEVL